METNYLPKKESFMDGVKIINQQGYANAVQFSTDYAQLTSMLEVGWSLAYLTGNALTTAQLPDNAWLYQLPLN